MLSRWFDPAAVILHGCIKDVRKAAGQDGVDKFIDMWRRRGFLQCSDDEAARLKRLGWCPSEEEAEKMGYDCAKNGANQVNCHFAYFRTAALTAAWERGKVRASKA